MWASRVLIPRSLKPARHGMTNRQLLWQVQLPLALGVIIAGVRVATVISVGLATIAAAIGAGGLGEYIFRGLAMVNNQVILAGAVPAALMALLADVSLGWLEKRSVRTNCRLEREQSKDRAALKRCITVHYDHGL